MITAAVILYVVGIVATTAYIETVHQLEWREFWLATLVWPVTVFLLLRSKTK